MRFTQKKIIFVVVIVVFVVAAMSTAVYLLKSIDDKLNQSAERRVIVFTQQAASDVGYRMNAIQNAIGSFVVQSDDPAAVLPALSELVDRFEFSDAAFATMDGTGVYQDGEFFSVDFLPQKETALSAGRSSYSFTYKNDEGANVRLAQEPLYIDGQQIGALYVQIPLEMFITSDGVDLFNQESCFILFQESTGEILVHSASSNAILHEEEPTFYDFIGDMSLCNTEGIDGIMRDSSVFLSARSSELRRLADKGETGLVMGFIDGVECYICISPVNTGSWLVCTVIPESTVRAETSLVTTMFGVVFGICILCIVVVAVAVFALHRKRMREWDAEMKTQLYEALSDSLELSVALYSPADEKLTPIASRAVGILGYPLREFILDPQLSDKITLSREGKSFFDRIREGKVFELEQQECSFKSLKTGLTRWAVLLARPLLFENKQQILVTVRDITPEREMQLSMKDALLAADAANKAKSEFLSLMSHEIRTPLNVIVGVLAIIKKNPYDSEKIKRNLDKMECASGLLASLISDVLDISKIESGKMVLAQKPFSLGEIIQHLKAIINPQCEEKIQSFTVVWPPSAEEIFIGDPIRLRQLLVNLLTNAVKYTPDRGHVRLDIAVGLGREASYRKITFKVSDDGIGMTPEFKEHLFEPFDMEGRSSASGTGLGMAIVKNIVTLMGGIIAVQTEVDKGTIITVELDLKVASPEDLECASDERSYEQNATGALSTEGEKNGGELAPFAEKQHVLPTGREEKGDFSGSHDMLGANDKNEECAKMHHQVSDDGAHSCFGQGEKFSFAGVRVLLVEDNEINAEIACELLSDEGMVVDWACDGAVACDMFKTSEPGTYDVIIMDVQMPVMDGYQATQCIRALERSDAATVPILAMSANAFAEDVQASLASGMNAHLTKPIDMKKVLSTLCEQLKKHNVRYTEDSHSKEDRMSSNKSDE